MRPWPRTWPYGFTGGFIPAPWTWRLKHAREAKAGSSYGTFILYWLDGQRPLGRVLELVRLESGTWQPGYALKYLELCQELGLVKQL